VRQTRSSRPDFEGGSRTPLTIVPLRDVKDIRDRWLLDRAAMYHAETRELCVNMGYVSARKLAERVVSRLSAQDPKFHARAQELAESALLRRVCRSAVFGLRKVLEPDFWNEGNIKRALSPESFSAVAEDLNSAEPLIIATLEQEFDLPRGAASAQPSE